MSGGGNSSNRVEQSPHEIELAKIAKEKWATYQEKFVPLENKYMDEIKFMNSPDRPDKAAGIALTEFSSQYEPQVAEVRKNNFGMGIKPGSGRSIGSMADIRTKGASVASNISAEAKHSQKDKYIKGIENIVGMGQGQSVSAHESMADSAKHAVEKAKSDSFSEWNKDAAQSQAFGTAVGMGARYGLRQFEDKS